jgi:GT2 family glycosyltransferase
MKQIEYLIELLPRIRYKVKIEPIQEIAELNAKKGQFKSTGHSPRFELVTESAYKGGWYYLEAALTNNNGNREANLYALDDLGYEQIMPIPSNLRGSIREVIWIPHGTVTIFWSPTASFGYFSQSQMLLHKITWLESYLRRLFRIMFDYWRFKEQHTISNTLKTIWQSCFHVQKGYLQTANIRINRLLGNDYETFIKKYDKLSKKQIYTLKKRIATLAETPVLSIIILVTGDNLSLLKRTLESVRHQLYPHWEMILVADLASLDIDISNYIQQNIEYDNRIKFYDVVLLTSNSALAKCSGSFVTYMGECDALHPKALYQIMQVLIDKKNTKLIYSDSDFIDDKGSRRDPCFKPDWNPDLFYSSDYIGNMCFYHTGTLREIGGLRSDFIGAEHYAATLRMTAHIDEEDIVHIPKVLYHQYSDEGEVKIGRIQDHDAGKHALQDFFAQTSSSIVNGFGDRHYRVRYPLSGELPLVSIIIPTRDRLDILKMCIDSIIEHTVYPNWEIIIIDNNSIEAQTHEYFTKVSKDDRICVYPYNKPFNYAQLNNFALTHAQGEILTLLNNDIEIISDEWLSELVRHALRPEIGVVGAKLLYPDGIVQHAGVIIGIGGVAGHGHKYIGDDDPGYCHRAVLVQNVSAVTGACMCMRRELYEAVGGLDENLAVAFNDVDFCLKVRDAGYRNLYTPYAKLIHHESISRGHDDTPKKHALFMKEFGYMKDKWGDKLKNDPAYNPNLTHNFENFGYKV